MRVWLIGGLLLAQAAAWGQIPDEAAQPSQDPGERWRALEEKAMRLIQATQDLGDWNEQYGYMLDATERMFERNGWDSESDLYTLELIREVGEIPPWDAMARFDKAVEMIGERYLLDDAQMASLESGLIQLNVDLFTRHADQIMEYGVDAIETRAAGEPFTPEQVARWTTLAEPVFQDARKSINKFAGQFSQELDAEQRELFQRDLDAANHRMRDIERMGQHWKRGEWDPHDWGMENDPIQNQGAGATQSPPTDRTENPKEQPKSRASRRPTGVSQGAEPAASEPEASEPGAQATGQPADNDPWAQYVRAFIKKYNLNDEQQQRAWLFYRDVKDRDAVFAGRFERQTRTLRERADLAENEKASAALQRLTEQHRREHERLFNHLKQRLERLPTRAQRKNAETGETGTSDSSAKSNAPSLKKP